MRYVGVWIDHRQATIVDTNENGQSCHRIFSHAEPNVRLSGGYGGATPYARQDVAAEPHFERKRRLHLRKYYRRVIHHIRTADGIFILGPGQAKMGLENEIRNSNDLSKKVLSVEPANRMTDNQLRAHIRNFFGQRVPQLVGGN